MTWKAGGLVRLASLTGILTIGDPLLIRWRPNVDRCTTWGMFRLKDQLGNRNVAWTFKRFGLLFRIPTKPAPTNARWIAQPPSRNNKIMLKWAENSSSGGSGEGRHQPGFALNLAAKTGVSQHQCSNNAVVLAAVWQQVAAVAASGSKWQQVAASTRRMEFGSGSSLLAPA
ncbi:hypothetical protein TWF173_000145 [Orbilia oligospora]|nr:hypothetical protein TWF173_000145 [Orbilia oligospora]